MIQVYHTIQFCTCFQLAFTQARVVNRTQNLHESWGFVRFQQAESAREAVAFTDWQRLLEGAGAQTRSIRSRSNPDLDCRKILMMIIVYSAISHQYHLIVLIYHEQTCRAPSAHRCSKTNDRQNRQITA